ncbi:DoxX family protein [Lacisediminihabitans changchengi]|uniref:DoxX family protein n=1 Tax=Lacisediminihabitans changchengi TaxID=2787634 RepID=A0A934W3A3_9MICO|nr:DoxX family protein [Lacisediminihabitans changchengi]MBK4346320.1 DoxX family protein [Lacisediminihabitans changchengi]
MSAFDIVQLVLRILVALIFVPMGINHFVPKSARAMVAMIPPSLKTRVSGKTLVRFTGVCEIAGGVGILIPASLVPGLAFAAGIALAVFLIAVFPANNFAAQNPERFGRAAIPFWPRFVAQVVLIAVILVAVV